MVHKNGALHPMAQGLTAYCSTGQSSGGEHDVWNGCCLFVGAILNPNQRLCGLTRKSLSPPGDNRINDTNHREVDTPLEEPHVEGVEPIHPSRAIWCTMLEAPANDPEDARRRKDEHAEEGDRFTATAVALRRARAHVFEATLHPGYAAVGTEYNLGVML